MAVSVRKLIHRGEARHAVRDRVALEDALHTTLPDDGRLVLVRRLRVRGEIADPARRQNAVRRGWVEAMAGAAHGGNRAANRANCVWFASREEAEAVLVRKLLAGEPVDGWFWQLAVPDWRLLPLSDWLPRAVANCLAAEDTARLARLAKTFVEAGRAELLVAAIERALSGSDGPVHNAGPILAEPIGSEIPFGSSATQEDVLAVRIAAKLSSQMLPAAWRGMLARLEQAQLPDAAKERVVAAILEEKIRRASPPLSLKPLLLKSVARAAREMLAGGHTGREEAAHSPPPHVRPLVSPPRGKGEEPGRGERRAAEPAREDPSGDRVAEATGRPAAHRPPRAMEAAGPVGPSHLRASDHAGLWLIVPALIRLGFGEWLAERPELLGENPGRSLILAVARHHRIGCADAALAPLAPVEKEDLPDWTRLWRAGLDRWLRRTARRRTHDLAARSGKFAFGEDRTDIHFPLDAADLRLRRLALDRDPGWVGWLGMSVRYHFGAEGVR